MKVYVLWKYPRRIYLLKVDHRKTRARCKICTKLTIEAPGQRQWRRFSAIIVKFEYISHFALVFLSLTLNVIAGWDKSSRTNFTTEQIVK